MRRILAAVLATALVSIASDARAQDPASATIVHGIPGVTVDVYVDGVLALPLFEPGTITDPVDVPAGTREVKIAVAGTPIEEAILEANLDVPAGADLSVVAHLLADGTPAISAFANDLSATERREGRIVVRHLAAAPAVDVSLYRLFRNPVDVEGLENGGEAQADLRAGWYVAKIRAAGTRDDVVRPFWLRIPADEVTLVYAIGSLEDGTFELLVDRLETQEPEPTTGLVTVVHGVPGLTVDVFVNGEVAIPEFAPKTITDPIELPAGDYELAIAPAGSGIEAAVITGSATLPAGADVSIVAHLAADGSPTLSVFVNDLSKARPARGRVVVRHTAAAPAVDVVAEGHWLRGAVEIAGLENGAEASADLFVGRYAASLFPAGGDEAVLGPATLFVLPARWTAVYAIGSLEDGTLELITQTRRLERAFGRGAW